MSEAIKPADTTATAQTNALWAVDEQLDAREIYNAEKRAEKFHESLTEENVEEGRKPVKDKMSRLALLIAQKDLSI